MLLKKHNLVKSMIMAAMLAAPLSGISADGVESTDAVTAQVTPQMQERAASLSRILNFKAEYRRGVFMYDRTLSVYEKNPEKLAARCKILGLTDIYYSFSDKHAADKKYSGRAAVFTALFHKYGLKVHALKYDGAEAFASDSYVKKSAGTVLDYNQSVKPESRFDAVIADLEPHILKKGRSFVPVNLEHYWNNDGYGPGKSNDRLVKQALSILALAKQELNGLEIAEALGFFFESRYLKGELPSASINNFLGPCAFVTLMAYANKPEKIFRMSESQLKNSPRPGSVAVCLKTSVGTLNDDGIESSLQPQGWDKLIEAADYVTKEAGKYPAFRGIDFFEYAGLEKMWENK